MLDQSHDRHVDRVPAETGYTGIGKVLPFDVPGSVEIGVDLIAARQTQKKRLRGSVLPVDETAPGTPLTGLPGIDGFNTGTNLFGLVGREGPKLGIAPAVMPPPLFAATLFGAAADMGQVLDHDHAARLHVLNDAFAQNVVAILPKPCLPPSHLLKMAFGGSAAFGLKLATKPEVPFFNLLPSPLPQELPVGQNGGSVDAEIDTDGLAGGDDLRWIDSQNDIEPPAGRAMDKIGTVEARCPVEPPLRVGVDAEREFDPARHGGQANDAVLGFHAVGAGVVPDAAPLRLRSRNFPTSLLQHDGGLDGFGRLHSGRNHQLARHRRMLRSKIVVRRLVQRDAVLLSVLPTVLSHCVEAISRSGKRLRQDRVLLGESCQTYADRALHHSYIGSFLSMLKLCSAKFPHFLCRLKAAVSMRGAR